MIGECPKSIIGLPIDHISDFLFAPTEESSSNLMKEKVKGKIFVTGNTIVDAVKQNAVIAKPKSKMKEKLGLKSGNYFLLTLHREENIDFKENITDILKALKLVAESFKFQMIFPIHPRTRKRIKYFKLDSLITSIKELKIIDPTGYLDFLALLEGSRLVLTDSGGIQEESCILRIPCVTIRESTERPETVHVGSNIVAGTKPNVILKKVKTMVNVKRSWKNPFGENVSRKIVDIIENELTL